MVRPSRAAREIQPIGPVARGYPALGTVGPLRFRSLRPAGRDAVDRQPARSASSPHGTVQEIIMLSDEPLSPCLIRTIIAVGARRRRRIAIYRQLSAPSEPVDNWLFAFEGVVGEVY